MSPALHQTLAPTTRRAWTTALLLCALTLAAHAQGPAQKPRHRPVRTPATAPHSRRWDARYTLTFYPGEWVTNAAGKSVEYAQHVTLIVSGDTAAYEDVHTKGVQVQYRCRVVRAPDSITLYAYEDVWKTRAMPTGPLCTIVRDRTCYYFKPGEGSEFSYIEPLPEKGLRLKRTAKNSR